MIYTSHYDACDLRNINRSFYSISGDKGALVNFKGKYCRELAPKHSFWDKWHNNIGKIPEDENNQFYIGEYWKQVLLPLSATEIYKKLDSPSTILLCYEKPSEFCHRHIVAAWLELEAQKIVPEVKIEKSGQLTIVERPKWIKEYLQQIIKAPKHD